MAKKIASKILVGAGAVAAIATGAALFFTRTKTGQKTAKAAHDAARELSKTIVHEMHRSQKITQDAYNNVVKKVVTEYSKKKKLAAAAAQDLQKELKGEWREVKREIKK